MDPGLFVAAVQSLNQHRLAQSAALLSRQQREEEARRIKLQEYRQELIDTAKKDTRDLLEQSKDFPQRAFVNTQLFLRQLDTFDVKPESFDDLAEKEEAVLIWRKLLNISEKAKSQLSKDQEQQCLDCLKAVSIESFIKVVASFLDPYQKYQAINQQIEHAKMKAAKKRGFQWISWLGILIIWFAFFLLLTIGNFPSLIIEAVFWPLTVVMVSFLFYLLLVGEGTKETKKLNFSLKKNYALANLDNVDFWNQVEEMFEGIPSVEQLKNTWNEQEMIISKIFGTADSDAEQKVE